MEGSGLCVTCEIRECRKVIQACRINMPPDWLPATRKSSEYTRELEMRWLRASDRIMEIHSLILSPETDDDDELDGRDEAEEPPTAVCAERPRGRSLFDE